MTVAAASRYTGIQTSDKDITLSFITDTDDVTVDGPSARVTPFQ